MSWGTEPIVAVAQVSLALAALVLWLWLASVERRLRAVQAELVWMALALARATRVCRACRGTDEELRNSGSWWVEEDLCSSCSDDVASSLEGGRRR